MNKTELKMYLVSFFSGSEENSFSCLATKRDMEYIKDCQKALRLEGFEVFTYSYGYPEYYKHNF